MPLNKETKPNHHKQDVTDSRFLNGIKLFYFSKTGYLIKAKEPSLPYYLPIFMPFSRTLVQSEKQTASSRI